MLNYSSSSQIENPPTCFFFGVIFKIIKFGNFNLNLPFSGDFKIMIGD